MNWTTITVGLEDLKAKIYRFYSNKIVIGIIRGDVFIYIYIYLLNLITSPILVVTVFFLFFFGSPLLSVFFLFYTVFILSSLPFMCRLGF